MTSLSDFRRLPVGSVDFAAREQAAVRWFIVNWIDSNVHPQPLRDHTGMRSVGISAADVEAETGYDPADLILTAYLARWKPQSGEGGSA